MSNITLEKLIYKSYLKTALSSILFIEVILLIIYFAANKSIVNNSINSLLDDIKKSVDQTITSSINEIEAKFNNIENITLILQNEHQNFFENNTTTKKDASFAFASNGVYYKNKDNGGSSVIVSNQVNLTDEIKNELQQTEVFDKTLKTIVTTNNLVTAAYYNSHNNYARYYPYINESYEVFPANFNITSYNFYKKANQINNPSMKPVWTDIYLDQAGKGWMLSVIAPIYFQNRLEGVSGIDITLNNIIDKILESKIPYDGETLLIDKSGNLIIATAKLEKVLSLYRDKDDNKIYERDSVNLLSNKNPVLRKNILDVISNKSYSSSFKLDGKKYLLFSKKVDKTSWYIVSFIDEEKITSKMRDVEAYYKNMGYGIVISIILFYIIFFIFLHYRAKEFVKVINKPLLKVVHLTKNLGEKKDVKKVEECGIYEIDLLTQNFNEMGEKLNSRMKQLKESENRSAFHEKLAYTDSLTNVYNRRFLDEYSKNYINSIKLNNTDTMSALALDIDDFKSVNDNYGHDIGDDVICVLVDTIKEVVRTNDLIVRLGGDEFLILLPNSNIINARKIGDFLLSRISQTKVDTGENPISFTISIGSAEFDVDDTSIDDLIKRADKALYRAKDLGKNCII